jgi:alpha-tubulin suppressor-like RCC1 family protein
MNRDILTHIQSLNLEKFDGTPSTYVSVTPNFPGVYEVRKSSKYNGVNCPSASSPFMSFPTDSLYQFPLIDGQNSPSEMRALISSSLFTYTKGLDMNEILEKLYKNSPFKKSSFYTRIPVSNASNLCLSESELNITQDEIELEDSLFEKSSEISRDRSQNEIYIDENDRDLIKQIQRDFHCRAENENQLKSLTPASSIEFNSSYSQDLSEMEFQNFVHRPEENSGSYMPNTEDFCVSLADEGHIQAIRFIMDIESSASKNLLFYNHTKPELYKVPPKSLGSMNSPYISLLQEISHYHPTSPILRKLVFCQPTDINDTLEIVSAIASTGFATALTLEFSNIEIQNKASVDYKKNEKFPITYNIAKAIANNSAIWISCGFEHCALVTYEGKVMTWGYGSSGCLGHGDTNSYGFPKLVKSLAKETCKYIECGGYHTLAIIETPDLYMWGRGDVNQLGVPHRQLCKDEHGYVALKPIKLQYFSKKIKGGACGEAHTLVIDDTGSVYSFGWGEDGQLGIGPEGETLKFKDISKIDFDFGSFVIKVAAGHIFSACLTEKGEVFIWGNGEKGQFGKEIDKEFLNIPQKIDLDKVIDIVCGESSTICVTENGSVYGWGLGKAGYFSSQNQSFAIGSELVCFSPKLLGEADIIHHYML